MEDSLIEYYLKDENNFYDEYEDTDYFDINFSWVSGEFHNDETRFITIDKSWKILQELLKLVDETYDKKLSNAITNASRLVKGEWIMYHKSIEVKELSLQFNKIKNDRLFSERNILDLEIKGWNLKYYKLYYENLQSFFDSVAKKGYGIVIKIE